MERPRGAGEFPRVELQFFSAGADEEIRFSGRVQPLLVLRVKGIVANSQPREYRNGALYAVPENAIIRPYSVETSAEVVWVGPALIQIPEKNEGWIFDRKYNAVKISIPGLPDVYDHRADRLQPFGLVEHIQKSAGARTFEFFNVRDFDGMPDEVKHILTESGLAEIE